MKFFYLGMHRCGTKSFGDFFRGHGYNVCSWEEISKLHLSELFFNGRWLDILSSGVIDHYDVFEDGPFFDPMFAKFLSNYIDDSVFVYFERPADDWYQSMITHSNGYSLGSIRDHAYMYDRLADLAFIEERLNGAMLEKLPLIGMRDHYVKQYQQHKMKVLSNFQRIEEKRFFHASLYDPEKFVKMCSHFDLTFEACEDIKSHVTEENMRKVLRSHGCLVE